MSWASHFKSFALFAVTLLILNFVLDLAGVKAWFYAPYSAITGKAS